MIKKLPVLCLTILLLLSFTACKKETAKSTDQPIIEGLTWGMSEKQVMNILDTMRDMDYKQYNDNSNEDIQENNTEDTTLVSFIELDSPIKKFGSNAKVTLEFYKEGYDGLAGEGLLKGIILTYSDVTAEDMLAQLKSALGDDYTESVTVLDPEIKNYIWESETKIEDLPQETYDNVCTYLKEKAPNTSDTILLPKVDESLNHITLQTTKSENQTSFAIVYRSDWEWLINYLNDTTK